LTKKEELSNLAFLLEIIKLNYFFMLRFWKFWSRVFFEMRKIIVVFLLRFNELNLELRVVSRKSIGSI